MSRTHLELLKELFKPTDPEQLRTVSDCSDMVHKTILGLSTFAAVCLAVGLALQPLKDQGEGFRGAWGGMMGGAWVISMFAAGGGAWAAIRTRRRYVIWAALFALPVAATTSFCFYLAAR